MIQHMLFSAMLSLMVMSVSLTLTIQNIMRTELSSPYMLAYVTLACLCLLMITFVVRHVFQLKDSNPPAETSI